MSRSLVLILQVQYLGARLGSHSPPHAMHTRLGAHLRCLLVAVIGPLYYWGNTASYLEAWKNVPDTNGRPSLLPVDFNTPDGREYQVYQQAPMVCLRGAGKSPTNLAKVKRSTGDTERNLVTACSSLCPRDPWDTSRVPGWRLGLHMTTLSPDTCDLLERTVPGAADHPNSRQSQPTPAAY